MAPVVERVYVAQPVPIGGGSVIASPFQFWLTGEDNLQVLAWTSKASANITLAGRVLREDGTLEPFTQLYTLTANRLANLFLLSIGRGFLLNLSVLGGGATFVSGELFVNVSLVRGLTGGRTYLGTILQGYVTNFQGLVFPGSPITLSTDGPGALRQLVGTDPPAGQDIDEIVPTGARWELISFFSLLVTDATPSTRRPALRLETGVGGILCISISPVTIPASTSGSTTFSQGMPLETAIGGLSGGAAGLPIKPVLLGGNHILIVTFGIAPGDNWQAPDISVREWLEGNA